MSFYRSDDVSSFKLVIPRQFAWDIMNKLGQKHLIHIEQSKIPVLTQPFLQQVRRCEETLQHLCSLQKLLEDKDVYKRRSFFPERAFEQIFQLWNQQYSKSSAHPASVLNDVAGQVEHSWAYHQDLMKKIDLYSQRLQFYRDNLAILKGGMQNFGKDFFTARGKKLSYDQRITVESKISLRCGVIKIDQELNFKRTVFRITKGNSIVHCLPFGKILDNLILNEQRRVVFFILYPGGNESYLTSKLQKLIQNFCENKYQLPTNQSELASITKNIQTQLRQTQNVLNLTQTQLSDFLNHLVDPLPESQYFRKHQYLKLYVTKEKELYNSLNQMELFTNFMQGSIYVKTEDIEELQKTMTQLQYITKHPMGQLVPSQVDNVPTHFRTNDFTRSAQEIVQTYGVADYKEANPAYFTCITFPFLFGVMFGDIGHGLILFAFSIFLIFKIKEDTANLIFKMLRPHRYLLCLMGFFATYCGFIYNDYLSISLNLFGSCYNPSGVPEKQPIPREEDCVYPFGLDPAWSISENHLNFVNSLKMKISVIIAVIHMTLGVFIKASNTIHFGKYIDFFFEFIPQLTFLILLFGYMDFLIIYKWSVDWGIDSEYAPSIITTMINIPLKMGSTMSCCGGQPMWGEIDNTSQDSIQITFLIVAVLSIPLMLFPKPLYLIFCQKKEGKMIEEQDLEHTGRLIGSGYSIEESQSVQFFKHKQVESQSSEIVVHQLIETIEYVLGCISNTASYLRLWALSLAHSQLSEVFFQKLVQGSITQGYLGIPMNIIGFIFLTGITFGVLLCMDSMQCFLHTLRLHWVEFNNKFYKGSGFPFVFYNFKNKIVEDLAKE